MYISYPLYHSLLIQAECLCFLAKTLLSTRMAREQDEVSWRHFHCEMPPRNLTLLYSQLLVNIQLLDKAIKLRQQKSTMFISLIV